MQKIVIVLFACLAIFGLATTASGQEKDPLPPDPLLQHTRDVLRACFEKGMTGIRPFVKDIKDEPVDSPRLKAIREFANSSHEIYKAWQSPTGDSRLRTFMNPDELKVARPNDTDGKPKDEILLRHDVPADLEMKAPDGKRVIRIIWLFKFVREGEKFLLESINKTFTTDSGQSAGVSL